MRVLQVHNYYQIPGGEDVVVEAEKLLLEEHEHCVRQFTRHNDTIKGLSQKIKVFFSTHYSARSRKEFSRELKSFSPDIVHIHNFFPLITPSILDACIAFDVPVVMTLHNYRIVDPGSLLLHNGKIDERSLQGSAYRCVLDGVYRDSILQTAVVAHMVEYHRKRNTWNTKVHRLLALSDFAKSKFIEGGIHADRITVKPNFVSDYAKQISGALPASLGITDYYIFVGRISSEKGIEMLVDTWNKAKISIPLLIIGDGPLSEKLKQKTQANDKIIWLGYQPKENTLQYIKNARALLFPSICYENFPMTILEAFCLGKPVIASNRGSHASIVKDMHTGIHFEVGNQDDLADKLMWIEKQPDILPDLGHNARKEYLEKYTPEKNYKLLHKIYQDVQG